MNKARPDPDALLAKVQREQARSRRGRLKIFFGAAAGVGKTYAMLAEARDKRREGVDVVVGVAEAHGPCRDAGDAGWPGNTGAAQCRVPGHPDC
ncbi:MAG: hypothetical protein WDN04_01370 [Rhodospirillales bacterium]